MSWQEKIERYKKEQQREQEEAARLKREEELRIAEKKREEIAPLLAALDRLRCEGSLVQIRDELWRAGDVFTTPKLEEVTFKTPISAATVLMVKWPCYVEEGWGWEGSGENAIQVSWPEGVGVSQDTLKIYATYNPQGEILINIASFPDSSWLERQTVLKVGEVDVVVSQLEKWLLEDCIRRKVKLPYIHRIYSPDPRVVELIRKGYKPPEGFEYLLDLAQKGKR